MTRTALAALLALGWLAACEPGILAGGGETLVPMGGSVTGNLVSNPGCEQDTSGWTGWRAKVARTTRVAHSGLASCRVSRIYGKAYTIDDSPATVTSPAAGTVYTAAAWVRSRRSVGKPIELLLRQRGGSQPTSHASSGTVPLKRKWQKLQVTATIDAADRTSLELYVAQTAASAHDRFEVDDLSLVIVSGSPDQGLADPDGPATPPTADAGVPPAETPDTGTTPTPDTGTTPTLDTGTSPTPDTGSPPVGDRWYAANSPWNTPIPANPAIEANSNAMVQELIAAANAKGFVIAVGQWTVPVYYADANTPKYDVQMTAGWAPANQLLKVPIPNNAAPDPAGDGHLMIVDLSTSCEYDFWQAKKSGGSWSASWGNRIEIDEDGFYDKGLSARGSGFALGGGLIRPEDIAAGAIEHALHFAFPKPKAGGPVFPATESDGQSTAPGAIPEGARVQLDPAFDVNTLPEEWQRIIARALQKYGMYCGDFGGAFSLYAQHKNTASTPYPWGSGDYVYLPSSLASHLRVLKTGPQFSPSYGIVPSRCGDFK